MDEERGPGIGGESAQFADYIQELYEVVQANWESLLKQSKDRPPSRSKVFLEFALDSQGLLRSITVVSEDGGEEPTAVCIKAIRSSEPFRPWTKEMIESWGHERRFTFVFNFR